MRCRKQARSGGKQKRRKPVPSKIGSRATSLPEAKGTKCAHLPWSSHHLLGLVENFTSSPRESCAQNRSCPGDLRMVPHFNVYPQVAHLLQGAKWTKT